jgi:hypothetical protein
MLDLPLVRYGLAFSVVLIPIFDRSQNTEDGPCTEADRKGPRSVRSKSVQTTKGVSGWWRDCGDRAGRGTYFHIGMIPLLWMLVIFPFSDPFFAAVTIWSWPEHLPLGMCARIYVRDGWRWHAEMIILARAGYWLIYAWHIMTVPVDIDEWQVIGGSVVVVCAGEHGSRKRQRGGERRSTCRMG